MEQFFSIALLKTTVYDMQTMIVYATSFMFAPVTNKIIRQVTSKDTIINQQWTIKVIKREPYIIKYEL